MASKCFKKAESWRDTDELEYVLERVIGRDMSGPELGTCGSGSWMIRTHALQVCSSILLIMLISTSYAREVYIFVCYADFTGINQLVVCLEYVRLFCCLGPEVQ